MELKQYLKENLTAAAFDNLHDLLSITPTRRTQLLNNPASAGKEEIIALAGLLKVAPIKLIHEFHAGYDRLVLSEAHESWTDQIPA